MFTRQRHTRRRAAELAFLGLCFVLLASGGGAVVASASTASTVGDSANGTLVLGWPFDSLHRDPAVADVSTDWQIMNYVYDGLTAIGNDGRVVPDIATSWKIAPSRQLRNKIWVFNIRRGVRFSNGRQLSVADVVGSLNRFVDPSHPNTWQSTIGAVRSIAASGPWQVKITLKTRNTSLPAALANPRVAILPMKELNAGTFDPSKETLGTGPYRVVSHVPNESWEFTRNLFHWRKGVPKARNLSIKIILDDSARIAALRNGSVHVASFTNPDVANLLRRVPNIETPVLKLNNFYYLAVNASAGSVFSDSRVRQALSWAINRQSIVRTALKGASQPSAAVPPSFGVCSPSAMPFAKPNLAAARKLIAAAGAAGRSAEIIAGTYDSNNSPIAQVLQQSFNGIGLKTSVLPLDVGTVLSRVNTYPKPPNFDLWVNAGIGYADPTMALRYWNPAASHLHQGYGLADNTLFRDIVRSGITPAGPKRNRIFVAICKRIARGGNIIPLVTKNVILAYRSDRVAPVLQSIEAYDIYFRNAAEYALK